jgi:hypothetical protein
MVLAGRAAWPTPPATPRWRRRPAAARSGMITVRARPACASIWGFVHVHLAVCFRLRFGRRVAPGEALQRGVREGRDVAGDFVQSLGRERSSGHSLLRPPGRAHKTMIWPMMLCAHSRVWRSSAGRPMTPPTSARMASCLGRITWSTTSSNAGRGLRQLVGHQAHGPGRPVLADKSVAAAGARTRAAWLRECGPAERDRTWRLRPRSGVPQDFVVEPQLVAEVIVHRGQIDSGARANVAHLGGLEAGLGEDMARGFRECGLRWRRAAWIQTAF